MLGTSGRRIIEKPVAGTSPTLKITALPIGAASVASAAVALFDTSEALQL